MPELTVKLTAHTVDTNMLYSILHSKRNECEIENNSKQIGWFYSHEHWWTVHAWLVLFPGERCLSRGGAQATGSRRQRLTSPSADPLLNANLSVFRRSAVVATLCVYYTLHGTSHQNKWPRVPFAFTLRGKLLQFYVCQGFRLHNDGKKPYMEDGIVCHVGCWQN